MRITGAPGASAAMPSAAWISRPSAGAARQPPSSLELEAAARAGVEGHERQHADVRVCGHERAAAAFSGDW